MNEHSNNDKPQIDQHVLDLLNGSIDGELNATEQLELDQLMASSEHVRVLHEEFTSLSSLLDKVPEREPPDYLQSSIEKQVRLPVENNGPEVKQGFLGNWLNANWLRTGFALVAGVVLTVGVYEMGSVSINDQDSTNMVGTMVKNPLTNQEDILRSILLNTDVLSGVVELSNSDELFVLDIQLNSDGPAEVVVDFSERGLVFEEITPMQDDKGVIHESDGSVSLISSGEQHYTMSLRRTSEFEQARPLKLEFFANNKLVREAELSVSQQ
jgi:hypothetical protein